jgi:hypothetical protein
LHRILPRFGPRPSATEARERPASWHRRYARLRVAFFITVALLVLFGILANRADQQRRRVPGTWERSERLTPGDPKFDGTGNPFDMWLVELTEGQRLRIDVRATDFAPFSYVIGPLSKAKPPVVATSGDSGEGHAHVALSPMSAGEYGVVVTSRGSATYGSYTLASNYRVSGLFDTDSDIDGVEDAFGVLFVLLLLLQLSGASVRAFWRSPDRILLLRPFGQGPVSHALKRLTRTHLAFRGFTFTLADAHLRHSLGVYALEHVPVDIGSLVLLFHRPLFRRMHRYVFLTTRRDLALLRFRLRSRWRLGMFWQSWLGLSDRINKIRSSDELWRDCIDVLFDNCQVIVVDLSHAGPGTTWELEQLVRRGYQYKALFLVLDDDSQVARARDVVSRIAGQCGVAEADLPAICRYASVGGALVDVAAFESAYAAAVASDRQPAAAPLPISLKALLAAMPIAVLGPLWSPAGLVLGLLALRDVRRADGMLRGEFLAHWAVVVHGALLCVLTALAGLALFR